MLFRIPRNVPYKDLDGYESTTVKTEDGLSIQLWHKKQHDRAILIVHGHFDHSARMNDWYSSSFQDLNYDLVFMDLRNHGRSSKNFRITIGLEESRDVKAVLEWMGRQEWSHIIVFGTSMGGIASSIAVPVMRRRGVEIRGLILDSVFIDTRDTVNRVLKKYIIMEPYRSIIDFIFFSVRFKGTYRIELTKQLQKINFVPKLIIHGEKDTDTAPDILEVLQAEKIKNLNTALIRNAIHSRLFKHPEFRKEIVSFIKKI